MRHKYRSVLLLITLSLFCITAAACGGTSSASESTSSQTTPTNPAGDTASSSAKDTPAVAGTRGSTPVAFIGSADGIETYGNESVTIDASHKDEGYVMVHYTGSNAVHSRKRELHPWHL